MQDILRLRWMKNSQHGGGLCSTEKGSCRIWLVQDIIIYVIGSIFFCVSRVAGNGSGNVCELTFVATCLKQ